MPEMNMVSMYFKVDMSSFLQHPDEKQSGSVHFLNDFRIGNATLVERFQ